MMVYETNTTGPKAKEKAYLKWLEVHIKHMLALPVFTKAEYSMLVIDSDTFGVRAKYYLADKSSYQEYLDKYSLQMRNQIPDELNTDLSFFRCRYST